jgi:hypothetical protein
MSVYVSQKIPGVLQQMKQQVMKQEVSNQHDLVKKVFDPLESL